MGNTWKDEETGLIWELKTPENIEDVFTWHESFKYAEKLNKDNFGGFNDWRVPTMDELKSIVSKEKNNGKFIKKELSENCKCNYWSSTTNVYYGDGAAWDVLFGNGYVGSNGKDYNGYVRCVRAGQ